MTSGIRRGWVVPTGKDGFTLRVRHCASARAGGCAWGGEITDLFSPTQARRLLVNSPLVPAAARRLAAAADVPPTTDGRDRT